MFARFTFRKINFAASRLISWVSNSSTTRWLSKNAIPKLWRGKRALLVVLWITITGGSSGAGNGTVNYSVSANSAAQRSGTITVNGQSFDITQAPNPSSCSYALNKTGEPISEQGGSGSLTLTTGGGCPWTAASNAGWLSVTSAPSGSGSATISYSVAANGGQQRIGSITVGGQTFTVTQAPNQASCTFALSPNSGFYPVEGGTGAFNVTTGAGCHWNANTTDGWITVTSGATGTGNGAVSFIVQANSGGSRTGGISVGGQAFAITQCGYLIAPTSKSFGETGGSGSISVSAAAGCPWSAVDPGGWITIDSGDSGVGNGTVFYSVAEYGLLGTRTGTISVAGRIFTITQRSASTLSSISIGPVTAPIRPCRRTASVCDGMANSQRLLVKPTRSICTATAAPGSG